MKNLSGGPVEKKLEESTEPGDPAADYAQQPFLMSESGAGAPREAFERLIKVVKEGKGIELIP